MSHAFDVIKSFSSLMSLTHNLYGNSSTGKVNGGAINDTVVLPTLFKVIVNV